MSIALNIDGTSTFNLIESKCVLLTNFLYQSVAWQLAAGLRCTCVFPDKVPSYSRWLSGAREKFENFAART